MTAEAIAFVDMLLLEALFSRDVIVVDIILELQSLPEREAKGIKLKVSSKTIIEMWFS